MKLARREIITVSIGGLIALAAIGYRLASSGGGRTAASQPDTFEGAIARIEEHHGLRKSVDSLSKELGVAIPTDSDDDQEKKIRRDLSNRANQHSLKLASIRRVEAGGKTRASSEAKPIQFRLEMSGKYSEVVAFIDRLEHATRPYSVREVQIESAARPPAEPQGTPPPPGSPPPPPPDVISQGGKGHGIVRATIKLHSYLFPEPMPKPTAKETPAPMKTPEAPAAKMSGDGAVQTEGATQAPKKAQPESPAPGGGPSPR